MRPAPRAAIVHAVHVDGHGKWQCSRKWCFARKCFATFVDCTVAVSLFDCPCLSLFGYLPSPMRETCRQAGGERCRAQIGETGQRARRPRVCAARRARVDPVDTRVLVRRRERRAVGNSQPGCRAGSPPRLRRIHSASTIAAASRIAGHTGSTTLVTPINTTSTSPRRDDLYLSIYIW